MNWYSWDSGLSVCQRANCIVPERHPSPHHVSDTPLLHVQDDSQALGALGLTFAKSVGVTVVVKFPPCKMGLVPSERAPVETRWRSSGVFSKGLLLSLQPRLTFLHRSLRHDSVLVSAGMKVALKDVLLFEASWLMWSWLVCTFYTQSEAQLG